MLLFPAIKVLLHIVLPLIFNDDTHVVILFNVVVPEIYNDDTNVVALCNLDVPDTFKLLVFNVLGLVKLFMYVNNVVDVAFKLSIFNLLYVDNEFK